MGKRELKAPNMPKTKGFIADFKAFISRGSVMDLAVGIIVGTAFTAIVNSLVKDIVMPCIGFFMGGINFESLKFVITPQNGETPESAVAYGLFIQKVVDFLIISLAVFIMIKLIGRFYRKKEPETAVSDEVKLLTEIRDLLQENKPEQVSGIVTDKPPDV